MSFVNSVHGVGGLLWAKKMDQKPMGFLLGQINDSFKMVKTVAECWYVLDLFTFCDFLNLFTHGIHDHQIII